MEKIHITGNPIASSLKIDYPPMRKRDRKLIYKRIPEIARFESSDESEEVPMDLVDKICQ